MNYVNKEMKIDQLVGYINADKINLIPSFQRGQVWTPTLRKKLIANMIMGRPIPAIFLYKEESGAMFAYNILDGKQRLESLILFIGEKHPSLSIPKVNRFFFSAPTRRLKNFKIDVDGKAKGFAELDEKTVRDFREYAIPTIEISLEGSSFAEIVDLFVDINTYGMKVSRFDVVKAMAKDGRLLGSVFDLIAIEEQRGSTIHYKAKSNVFVKVLGAQHIVSRLPPGNSRVDRMWERLTEIALFARSKRHRAPVDILKSFMKGDETDPALSAKEIKALRSVFDLLATAYKTTGLGKTRLATDQPQFYTMVTTLLVEDLSEFTDHQLIQKLNRFSMIADEKVVTPPALKELISEYREVSERQTTHVGRRATRQKLFVEAIRSL